MQILEKILEEIDEISYPSEGIGCGLEDVGITDRYEAAAYGWDEAVDGIAEIIRSHMEDKPVSNSGKLDDGWISVEERLPEDCEKVLVWYEYFRYGDYNRMYQTYGIGYQHEGHWSGDVQGTKARCIAWRPLPKPYQTQNRRMG